LSLLVTTAIIRSLLFIQDQNH